MCQPPQPRWVLSGFGLVDTDLFTPTPMPSLLPDAELAFVDTSDSLENLSAGVPGYPNKFASFHLLASTGRILRTRPLPFASNSEFSLDEYTERDLSLLGEAWQQSETSHSGNLCLSEFTAYSDAVQNTFNESGFELWPDSDFCAIGNSQFETDFVGPVGVSSPKLPLCSSNGNNIQPSARAFRCDWPQCSSLVYLSNGEERKRHDKLHAQEMSNSWEKGQRCPWPKCSSNATHKSRNLFEVHLNNIHVNPLVCTVEHCKHRKPFRANHDLQRHIATAHNPYAKYVCPYESCADRCRGFSRKDKWLSHLREHHNTEWCPFAHCPLRQEHPLPHSQSTSKHIGKAHSNLECALKSCEGKISRFSETQLLEHLELHHAMEWALGLKARNTMKAFGDHTLRSEHLLHEVPVCDCKICGE